MAAVAPIFLKTHLPNKNLQARSFFALNAGMGLEIMHIF